MKIKSLFQSFYLDSICNMIKEKVKTKKQHKNIFYPRSPPVTLFIIAFNERTSNFEVLSHFDTS